MIGQKLIVASLLLLTAVPAGCLPLYTLGAVGGEVIEARKPAARRHSGRDAVDAIGITLIAVLAGLAALANWRFWRLMKRARSLGNGEDWLGLGRHAWITLLSVTYGMGVLSGGYMIAFMTGIVA